jgi:hypothetical protein
MSLTKTPKRRRALFGATDRAQELPEGSLPCRSCGIAVVLYADTVVETHTIRGPQTASGHTYDRDILVSRCNACEDRREHAAAILRAHPAVAREHGNVGTDRLDAALAALDVLNRSTLIRSLTLTDDFVRDLIAALSALGGWCSWSASSAAPGVSASRRWGHVSDLKWEDTRSAFARLIGRRMELPKPIAPPSDRAALRACGFCGIETLFVKESDARAAWGDERQMPLASMGGWGGEVVTAHVCPACRAALFASDNAMGLPAVWLAVIRSRGYEPRSSAGVVSLSGVKPWAALARGTEPNATPWAHVNLEALDRELASTTVVRRIESSDQPASLIVGWVQ